MPTALGLNRRALVTKIGIVMHKDDFDHDAFLREIFAACKKGQAALDHIARERPHDMLRAMAALVAHIAHQRPQLLGAGLANMKAMIELYEARYG
jgi:hypothetical protein